MKEHFVIGLRIPIPSLHKQFVHFSGIPPTYIHLNAIQILMGCSVLDVLYQLDLFLLKILFIYAIKMRPREWFSLTTHTPSLQLVIGLSNSKNWWAKCHVLVFGSWSDSIEGPNHFFSLNYSIDLPSIDVPPLTILVLLFGDIIILNSPYK